MCGFTGYFSFSSAFNNEVSERIAHLNEALEHRGPDYAGLFEDDQFCVGHRRLAIIDLDERSNQPFLSPDKRYVLVYNGEIYNFKALREDLESRFSFSTESDTEVLLAGLINEGSSFISKLNGCFAFAFYDSQKKELLLARDPFGIKPLYFTKDDHGIAFASEERALLDRNQEINLDEVKNVLSYTYPTGGSIAKNTQQLAPKSFFVSSNQSTNSYPNAATSDKDLFEALDGAVERRLVADVPVGCFLSGGLDSSIISALASKKHPNINTFSIGFKDRPHLDETSFAEEVANHIGSNHHTFKLSFDNLGDISKSYLDQVDTAFADSSALAVYFLSQECRKHVTVALSGDGADELFGGYRKHRAMLLANKMPSALAKAMNSLIRSSGSRETEAADKKRQVKKMLELASIPSDKQAGYLAQWNNDEEIDRLLKEGRRSELTAQEDFLQFDQQIVLPNDMLVKVDRMSMQHSLEVRVPFLDPNVVAIANAMPLEQKVSRKEGKIALKKTFGHLLPASILERSKKGFEVPLSSLLNGPLAAMMQSTSTSESLAAIGFDLTELKQIIAEHASGKQDHAHLLWAVLVLEAALQN